MSTESALERVLPLTIDQREEAAAKARKRIAGATPVREEEAAQKLPASTVKGINLFVDVVMFAAFVPSAIRVFLIAGAMFSGRVDSTAIGIIAGLCGVLIAESGQIGFTLAAAKTSSRMSKGMLYAAAAACTAYTLVANGRIAQPTPGDAFDLLETYMPPLLVLVAANVRKWDIINRIRARKEAADKYEEALRRWQLAFDNAPTSDSWLRLYANELQATIRAVYKRSAKMKEYLNTLTNDQWGQLVQREFKADQWYVEVTPVPTPTPRIIQVEPVRLPQSDPSVGRARKKVARKGSIRGTHNGATDGAVTLMADGKWHAVCPRCGKDHVRDEQTAARNALGVHMGRYCTVEPSANGHSKNGVVTL